MKYILSVSGTALLLAAGGCGGGDKRAEVTGKVSVSGKGPLSGGTISFVSTADAKRVGSGVIAADGSYRVTEAPVGECKVTVDNSHLNPAANKSGLPGMAPPGGMGGMPGMKGAPSGLPGAKGPPSEAKSKMGSAPKGVGATSEMGEPETANSKYVKIDAGFAKPESTPLTGTVTTGTNNLDFEVK